MMKPNDILYAQHPPPLLEGHHGIKIFLKDGRQYNVLVLFLLL